MNTKLYYFDPIIDVDMNKTISYQFIFQKSIADKFPKLTKNEKKFIKDVQKFENIIKEECAYINLSDIQVKKLIWDTIKELQNNKIATDDEVKNFLKARPEYLEFI